MLSGFTMSPDSLTVGRYSWHKQELFKGRATARGKAITFSSHMGWGLVWGLGDVRNNAFQARWTVNPDRCHITMPDGVEYTFAPASPSTPNETIASLPKALHRYTGKGGYQHYVSTNIGDKKHLLCKPAQQDAWRVAWVRKSAEDIAFASDAELRRSPIFPAKPEQYFKDVLPSEIKRKDIDGLLADAIPALSPALGTSWGGSFVINYNLESMDFNGNKIFKADDNEWPRNHTELGKRWTHSEMADMAYPYKQNLFHHMVSAWRLK